MDLHTADYVNGAKAVKAITKEGVLNEINLLKKYVNEQGSELPNKVYTAMDGISKILLNYKEKGGETGWSKNLTKGDNPILRERDSAVMEELLPTVLTAVARKQSGGALDIGRFQFKPQSELLKPDDNSDISIDSIVKNVQSFLYSLDEKNRQLAAILGPVAIVSDMKERGSIPPLSLLGMIPAQSIGVVITTILEACRLLVSSNAFDVPLLRKIFSFILAIFDVLRGDWRDGVLTLMGLFSNNMMFFGMVGKTARWMYGFISPDIQERIGSDIYDASKSMIIGSWLWVMSIVAPDYVRFAVNNLVESVQMSFEQLNQKISSVEENAQEIGRDIGVKITFPRLPLNTLPTFDDIQNLQSLLHTPEIICNPIVKDAIESAKKIGPIRIVLELLNIPLEDDKLGEICKGQPADVGDVIEKVLTPTVTLAQEGEEIGQAEQAGQTPERQLGGSRTGIKRYTLKRNLKKTKKQTKKNLRN
jgi:hypothetical protein